MAAREVMPSAVGARNYINSGVVSSNMRDSTSCQITHCQLQFKCSCVLITVHSCSTQCHPEQFWLSSALHSRLSLGLRCCLLRGKVKTNLELKHKCLYICCLTLDSLLSWLVLLAVFLLSEWRQLHINIYILTQLMVYSSYFLAFCLCIVYSFV